MAMTMEQALRRPTIFKRRQHPYLLTTRPYSIKCQAPSCQKLIPPGELFADFYQDQTRCCFECFKSTGE